MDIDFCGVCGRRVSVSQSLYCSEVCRWKDSNNYHFDDDDSSRYYYYDATAPKPKPKPYCLRPSTLETLPPLKPLSLPLPLCARASALNASPLTGLPNSPSR
ncbi:hypothetical protein H4R35_003053, partial [Dimargaris xerosporica]